MLYTPAINKALKLTAKLHTDQLDKNEVPYLAHPLHLAEQMDTEAEICAALLHDVLEDSSITAEELVARGIPETAVNAILLLTHEEGVPYLDYVKAIQRGDYGSKTPVNDHDIALARLYHAGTPSVHPYNTNPDLDPLTEGARIAQKVKKADLRHNSELGRLSIVSSRDIKRLKKYREARVILGDLVYRAKTPVGSFSVKTNGEPYAFHAEKHSSPSHEAGQYHVEYVFQVDVLGLEQNDKVEAVYFFGDTLLNYESNDTAVCTTYKKGAATITFSACTTSKFAYTENYPFQLLTRMGSYKITNDPIKYRFYPETHTIEYRLSIDIEK